MFRHSETLVLFGLTAFHSVFAVKRIQDYLGFGMLPSVVIGVLVALVANCIEMTFAVNLFKQGKR